MSKVESHVATPNYECKLFLDPSRVLALGFKPAVDARQTLGLGDSNLKIAMQFIDGRPVQIHPAGWDVRVRRFEHKNVLELTFKRRIGLADRTLDEALALAANEGLDGGDADYDAQVEWGFAKRTLSFSRKKEMNASAGGDEMDLPSRDETRAGVTAVLPGKLDRFDHPGWARGVLATGEIYGPVLGHRWTGNWKGTELSLEVWLVKAETGQGIEPIVELSFKEKREDHASDTRDELMAFVRKQGWLLETDVLKTEMILNRY